MAVRDINIDNTPLSEKIAHTIRNNIIKGIIKPGERLVEPKLSEMLGISRTPIREALRLLEMEGFIDIIPRRGAVVTTLTRKDIDDIFIIKMKLEPLASRLAVDNLEKSDIDRLKELAAKMEAGSAKGVTQMINWNYDFHNIFIYKCNNDRLIRMLDGLQQQFKRATVYSFTTEGRTKKVNEEHLELIKAFEKKDSDSVEKIVETHVYNGWQFIRVQFEEVLTQI
ncbi:transcriptional regulator, GntR family [Denitrovibrio acetiphilus DSM 12809]|uniref:Transcriptional regulator, GntR family n=1 Tax=Denitrovibrio acetiphilus (strain DSM 12809 / NBRC 114555 / N2460) TaxID=522772 RepID=D4H0N4_DENA2|nr:GntR family transcriptional regulator [Denitrovibrio acetiphilus]ADD68547.1 transcriptional regulator, GntR family [Denitrovibrio acetiphilus DSM 12809]